jgi:hypothetical protein
MYHIETVNLKEELRTLALYEIFNPIPGIPSGLFQQALDCIEDLEERVEGLEEDIQRLEERLEEEIDD